MNPLFPSSKRESVASGRSDPEALETLLEGNASFRRRMVASVSVAIFLLAGISIALAWRQYDDARARALTELEARVVAVSAIIDTSFAGQISTLDSIAASPSVVDEQTSRMEAYFSRVNPRRGGLFSGGIGWIDRDGRVRASSAPGSVRNLSGRLYFRRVLATGKPYVSAGLIGSRLKEPIVVVAVPTRNGRGRVSGVLVGGIVLKTAAESKQARELGFGDLQIVDRNGRLLLSHLDRVANTRLLARIKRTGTGVLSNTAGFDGHGEDVVAFGVSKVPAWTTVIDRPGSTVFGAAVRAFVLELASVGAGMLLVLLTLVAVVRRSRRDSQTQVARARSWSGLTRALGSAATPSEVTEALISSLAAAFTEAIAIVAFETGDGLRVKAASHLRRARPILESKSTLEKIAPFGREGPKSRLLENEPAITKVGETRLDAIHSLPILDNNGQVVGTIALLSADQRLDASQWALLASFADQGAQALERAQLFAHEHDLAVRLQQSLLPDRLPSGNGVELAGHYLAGGDGVEVGGDWYDALRRPDGIIQLCVGDVSGRGIDAATMMGRQRNTFRVYAHDYLSPAEITRRMLRHVNGDEMVTMACISLDPYTGELSYSCAGHPPPLLVDQESGEVIRLDRAGAPPIGVAQPADIVEAHLELSGNAVLTMYTDGLIERRGEDIDAGIDFLGQVVANDPHATPDGIVAKVTEAIGAPDDDVALLLIAFDGKRTTFELEVPADPAEMPRIRRRLRGWLARRRLDVPTAAEIVLAVSEACSNAIEHACPDREGTIRLSIREDGKMVRAVIEDQGSWRDAPAGDERGHGITVMKHLMHSAEFETGTHGTRVTLVRSIDLERQSVLAGERSSSETESRPA